MFHPKKTAELHHQPLATEWPGRIWWLPFWKTAASRKSRITGIPCGISRYTAVRTPKYPKSIGGDKEV